MKMDQPSFDDGIEAMAEINMTPLVDVMLVLLIIFMVTLPVINQSVRVDLPKAGSSRVDERPPHITLSIDAQGAMSVDGEPVSADALAARFAGFASREPRPELHIRADKAAQYDFVARAMAAASRAGLGRMGFLTSPEDAASGTAAAGTEKTK